MLIYLPKLAFFLQIHDLLLQFMCEVSDCNPKFKAEVTELHNIEAPSAFDYDQDIYRAEYQAMLGFLKCKRAAAGLTQAQR